MENLFETLRALAAPKCKECEERIVRAEMRWHLEDGEWCPGPAYLICPNDHRIPVEPL